jgi:alpha/beta superfamily hydrolase
MDWNETPAELVRAWAEQPVIIPGEHGDLYGIFTPPAPEASAAGLCVILFSRNRWWCDRISIKSARWLAARGFPCLRFDYHGFGESEGDCQVISGDEPFTEDALAAIRYMRKEFGQQRFALSGFCFDGRTALSAIEEEGDAIEAVVCTSPEITTYPGEVLTHIITLEKARSFLFGSPSFKKGTLRRALRRFVNLMKLARENRPGEGLAERQVSMNFKRSFRALVDSKTRCLILQGREDTQYHAFQLVERTLLAQLDRVQKARITVEVWPGQIHLLESPGVLRKVAERTLFWIDECRQRPLIWAPRAKSVTAPQMSNGLNV